MRKFRFSRKATAIVATASMLFVGAVAATAAQAGGSDTASTANAQTAEMATARTANVAPAKASGPVYFVHGYDGESGKNCKDTWANGRKYFADKGWDPKSLHTVGYYAKDTECDASVAKGDNNTSIKDLAAGLANYIYDHHTKKGESVEIVAHSMGGLVTRVAMLGSAKGWAGFPSGKLKVSDIATLGTPHNGVICEDDAGDGKDDCSNTGQWLQMDPDSNFMKVLHAKENQIGEPWADGTDWSFAGSDEDETVSGTSAIDKGEHADHKYRYLKGSKHTVTHAGIRKWYSGDYKLRYWHASTGESKDTTNGWAPLETAFNALAENEKW